MRPLGGRQRLSSHRQIRNVTFLLAELGLIAVLAALPFAFFLPLFVGDANGIWTIQRGDFDELHLPYRVFFARELAQGTLPLWDPFVAAGHSALGDMQHGIFYPFSWLFALLAGAGYNTDWLEAQIVFHFGLAAVFTYLFARTEVGSRPGAFSAAIIFTFGGYLTSFPVQQLVVLQVSVWLPLALLPAQLAARHRSPALAIGVGLVLSLAVSAGHPQTLFYVVLLTLAYLVASSAIRNNWQGGLALAGLALATALAISSPQLLPAMRQLGLTDRTDVTYEFLSVGFRPVELAGLFLPSLAGGAALYYGLATLALVGLALVMRQPPALSRFWAGVLAIALVDSLGGATFLQGFLSLMTPVLKFRHHERVSLLLALAVAVLAGHALAYLSRQENRQPWAGLSAALFSIAALGLTIGLAVILLGKSGELADQSFLMALFATLAGAIALLAVRGLLRPQPAAVALLLVLGLDLFSQHWQTNLMRAQSSIYPTRDRAVAYLQATLADAGEPWRIASEGLLPGDGNAGALWRLPDIVGNSPLETRYFGAVARDMPEMTYWRLWSVRYIVTKRSLDHPALIKLLDDGERRIYELKPDWRNEPAWFADRIGYVTSDQQAVAILRESDPKRRAVVHDVAALPIRPVVSSSLTWLPGTVNERGLLVNTDVDGLLVISQSFHPDWRGYVDEAPATIVRVNLALTGVVVPAGRHQVTLRYESPELAAGLVIAAIGALVALVVIAVEVAGRMRWRLVPSLRSSP